MALWATKRRFIYAGGILGVLVIVFGGIFWGLFYRAPTCNDGVKNGDETGVDCGGSCQSMCTSDTLNPIVLWSKVFNISGDVYSAVAYVENPNIDSNNPNATYEFRLFDVNNDLVTVKDGETSIPKGKKFAIFETGIISKNTIPTSADFRFVTFSPWQKDTVKEPDISVTYGTINSASTTPSLTGTVTNQSIGNISKIELVAVILDSKENTVGASRTYVDDLAKGASQDFVFTWQKPFDAPASVISVIYRFINP